MTYRIVIVDMFHAHDEDGSWPGGEYATLAEAIAAAKTTIDAGLRHMMDGQVRGNGPMTAAAVVSRYGDFAEHPLVFGPDQAAAFDSWAYVRERAGELLKG